MTPSPPVEESCFWMARRHARRTPEPLQGVDEADVAIVGGGYTGLWTALFLKELEPRRKVVVLEQELVGYGGSGRNAGIVGETIDHSHELAIAHFGLDEARRLARLGRENLDAMETFLRERGIDCRLRAHGPAHRGAAPGAPRGPGAGARGRGERGLAGLAHPLPRRDAVRAGEPAVRRSAPGSAQRRGRSRAVDRGPAVRGGPGGRPHSRADARHAVGVSRRPRRDLGGRRDPPGARSSSSRRTRIRIISAGRSPGAFCRCTTTSSSAIRSRPAQRKAIGWRSRRAVIDVRTFFNYYRLTDDGRILWGTSEAAYYPGNRVDAVLRPLAPALRGARGELPAATSRSSRASRFRTAGAGRSRRRRG